ncbi:hypothetical protein [Salinirussus salinus]|nr:hypothetical protein [Salinirussus salinus]
MTDLTLLVFPLATVVLLLYRRWAKKVRPTDFPSPTMGTTGD